MKHEYINFSCKIFAGFYETFLYNSDMLYNEQHSYNSMPEGYELEIDDFVAYQNEIGKKAVDKLYDQLYDFDVIQDMNFKEIVSPAYYNFETDKLVIDIDYDEDALKKYCFETFADDFDNHLHEMFSSRDGFISFVPNNLKEFKEWNDDRMIDVMIEFYLLQMIDFESYEQDLYDSVSETFYNHLCLYKDKEYFEYSLDDEENVIVGEKIEK